MNRRWKLFLGISLITPLIAASPPKANMICSNRDDDVCIDRMIRNPPMLRRERLPAGTKIGRCLLVVNGKTRISGPCSYSISRGGDFHIDGPRQVFDGIDYPKAGGMAEMISTDWWADVFRDSVIDHGVLKMGSGPWIGYSNETIGSVHGQESRWGSLTRHGACYDNHSGPDVVQIVRVCLWKK